MAIADHVIVLQSSSAAIADMMTEIQEQTRRTVQEWLIVL